MGRVGQSWKTAGLLFRELAKLPHLIPEGLYTHFASAESNDLGYSRLQLDRFNQVLETARKLGLDFRFAHAANSGALLQMGDEASYNMVRPGIALYGLTPSEHLNDRFDLKPVMSLLTRVVFVKRPPAGTPVGYGSTWKSPGNRWIATLPIGYGDGFPRRAGNRANVVLRGRLCPIVGNVSMDQTTIDAGVEAYLDDEVVIFGSSSTQTNSIWRLCLAIDAIPYEILCGLTARVPRVYVD
jgi:alanine racemase